MELKEIVIYVVDEQGRNYDVEKEKPAVIINGEYQGAELKDVCARIVKITGNEIVCFSLLQFFDLKDGVFTTKEGNTVSLAIVKGEMNIPLKIQKIGRKGIPLDPMPVRLQYIQVFSEKLIGIEKPELVFYDLSNSEKKILVDARSEKYDKRSRDASEKAAEKKQQEEQQQQQEDNAYKGLIAEADEFAKNKEYENAKLKYAEAQNVKPSEEYPAKQIKQIDAITEKIATRNAENQKYKELLAGADKMFEDKDYQGAKKQYIQATEMNPKDDYPKEKLKEIEKIYSEIAREKKYKILITDADRLFDNKEYDLAKKQYIKAREENTLDEHGKQRISEIDKIVADALKEQQETDRRKAVQARKLSINSKFIHHKKDYHEQKDYYLNELGGKHHTNEKYELFYVPDEDQDEDNPIEPLLLIKEGDDWWYEVEEGEIAEKTDKILGYQFTEGTEERLLLLDLKKDHSVLTNVKK